MYHNTTDGARDINGNSNSFIVSNLTNLCSPSGYEAILDESRAFSIRNNLESIYMEVSEAYVLIMMLIVAFLCCVYVPYNMKERDIPIYFRQSQSNVFLDFLNLRITAFFFFIVLSGCLPHLNFYVLSTCLHTASNNFGIQWTDNYQYCLVALIWVITVPLIVFLLMNVMNDNLRYSLIPIIIGFVIFLLMVAILSIIIIVNAIIYANSQYIRIIHLINVGVLIFSIGVAGLYGEKFAKKDLLKTDEEEIHI